MVVVVVVMPTVVMVTTYKWHWDVHGSLGTARHRFSLTLSSISHKEESFHVVTLGWANKSRMCSSHGGASIGGACSGVQSSEWSLWLMLQARWMDGRMDGWMDGWMYEWMDGWTDGWMDEWMDGWMDGWMDIWTDGLDPPAINKRHRVTVSTSFS